SPYLARLTSLNLSDVHLGPEGLRALLQSPHLARVQKLNLAGGSSQDWTGPEYFWPIITLEAVRVLAHTPDSSRLQALDLSCNLLGDEAAAILAASPCLTGLRDLQVARGNELSEAALQALRVRYGKGVS